MKRFPSEFSELLTPRGRRILDGRDARARALRDEPGLRFLAFKDAIDPKKANACRELIERAFPPVLERMEQPIPPETILGMQENYAELLPKTVRNQTAFIDRPRSKAREIADELGLNAMLRSPSFGAFAAAISGRALQPKWGLQLICYGEGDYSGPHNDHHPEDPKARDGYLDVHLTLSGPGVAHQWLVWGHRGHFSRMERIDLRGGITAYKLPFWHLVTPLAVKKPDAKRWVLLGTFLYADEKSRTAIRPPAEVRRP